MHAPPHSPQSLRLEGLTLLDAVASAERAGYTGQFGAQPGGIVRCFTCREDSDARNVALSALHRVEGASDPDANAAVAAVECPRCGAKGTLVMSYGPGSPPEDHDVLRRLQDER